MRKKTIQSRVSVRKLILVLLIIIGISSFASMRVSATTVSYDSPSFSSLTPHASIYITSDVELEVFAGSGIEGDPYVIEGYEIITTNSKGIHITGTTKYFTIRNCYVEAADRGIYIDNVSAGTATIINNTCSDQDYGIFIESSANSTVSNNICSDSYYGMGIYVISSANTIIVNNICTNNRDLGIFLLSSVNTMIVNNTITDSRTGMYISASGGSICANNTCSNGRDYGIQLWDSFSTIIANNSCSNCNIGIFSWYSSSSTITNNSLTNCGLEFKESNIGAYQSYTITNNWVNGKQLGFLIGLDSTIIADPTYGQIIMIDCNNVTVSNQILDNTSIGLFLHFCTDISIINNTCNNNYNKGMYIYHSSGSTIANNTCSNNIWGIHHYYSGSSTVANNTCSDNDLWGIALWYSDSSSVVNNTFANCGLSIGEVTIIAYQSYTVTNNWVNGKQLGFFTGLDSIIIADPIYGQIVLIDCNNVAVSNQILNNASAGLRTDFCTFLNITNNTCNNNSIYGMSLRESSSSTVTFNTCSYNKKGLDVSSSDSSIIANNTCNNNIGFGITFGSDSSIIANNTCCYNGNGIEISSSVGSTITNNMCNNNNGYGIYLDSSTSSSIANNTCCYNEWGIFLESSDVCIITYNLLQENEGYGIYLSYCYDNVIHHNTFVDNNPGSYSQAYDHGTNNVWYDSVTFEGNYWSDWSGVGSYSIDGPAGSSDLYPLGEPVIPPISEFSSNISVLILLFVVGLAIIPLSLLTRKRSNNK